MAVADVESLSSKELEKNANRFKANVVSVYYVFISIIIGFYCRH
jgi:hypothetical protein